MQVHIAKVSEDEYYGTTWGLFRLERSSWSSERVTPVAFVKAESEIDAIDTFTDLLQELLDGLRERKAQMP